MNIRKILIKLQKKKKDEYSENFNKQYIKKNQRELNNTITASKSSLEGINSRLDNTEDQISELEYRVVRISQAELKKGKRIFKNEAS